jgi:hypothetical protein
MNSTLDCRPYESSHISWIFQSCFPTVHDVCHTNCADCSVPGQVQLAQYRAAVPFHFFLPGQYCRGYRVKILVRLRLHNFKTVFTKPKSGHLPFYHVKWPATTWCSATTANVFQGDDSNWITDPNEAPYHSATNFLQSATYEVTTDGGHVHPHNIQTMIFLTVGQGVKMYDQTDCQSVRINCINILLTTQKRNKPREQWLTWIFFNDVNKNVR